MKHTPKWVPSLAWLLAIVLLCCGIRWWFALPTVGKGGLFLAIGAAVMPLFWEKISPPSRTLWLAALFLLVFVEYRAIDKDRKEADQRSEQELKTIGNGFSQVLSDQQKSFEALIAQSQGNFQTTMSGFIASQEKERAHFEALIKKDDELFEHEQKLAENLDGRLMPGSDPTPENACGELTNTLTGQEGPRSSILLLLGKNASIINKFPHTVLTVIDQLGRRPAVVIDRSSDGSITVKMDVRSSDGRVVALLNEKGFVVNRNNYLQMRKDKSSLAVIDEYGDEVLNAHYVNRQVFSLSGILRYPHVTIPLQQTGANCTAALGNGTIETDFVFDIR